MTMALVAFINSGGHTWRKQVAGAGIDDVSLRYSSQLKASKEKQRESDVRKWKCISSIKYINY